MRTGRSCGRFRRSEREVLREFHTPWKRMCIVFPTLSTESSVDSVDGPVQDVETMFALALALTLAAPGPRLDPQHLPRLPATGFARQLDHAVALETLAGRPLGRLAGFTLAEPRGTHGLLLARGRARYSLDLFGRRIRQVFPMGLPTPAGCRFADASTRTQLFLCGHTMKTRTNGRTRILVKSPGRAGHWEWAEFSRDGSRVLAEWSAECEIPVAYELAVASPRLNPVGADTLAQAPEAVPLGWLAGMPVIHLRRAACGSGAETPGIYLFRGDRAARLLLRVPRFATYAMWGG
jgi:hypothetical protein